MRKINWWMVATAVLVLATPIFMVMEFKRRGYFAIGGECMIWLYPLIPALAKKYGWR